ncbi:AAA family ATPase [Cellulomonas sp. PhB143]|uniref:AAA family ATPase n=1 Tax=Cellulomonas sp. PhB143 TaxID=2485186 RepID=UPI000F46E00F|nr:AAA family ATPase [Cellulomonas sp. PhB143]ROS77040.1 ATPase family protein associated with various cellular activities (AAA) [Cellulomonas sp. PhB143]
MTAALADTVAAAVAAAREAGLDAGAARTEALRLTAAVAESAPGAAAEWLAAVGEGASLRDFFGTASLGRRWRTAPTDLTLALAEQDPTAASRYTSALADAVEAAARLGEPAPGLASAAARTAAVHRSAAHGSAVHSTAVHSTAVRSPGDPDRAPQAPVVSGPAPADATPAEPLADVLAELDALVGLGSVKREVRRQAELLRVEGLRAAAGLGGPTLTRHLVFTGNPGTGKTTVGRLVARIYRSLGILSSGHLVEVDRSELVAGYLGQTAERTTAVVTSALGGVLLVDEAYALAGDRYGEEAVDTLVKDMEDHRDDLVVIVAGYPGPMTRLLESNPGLRSRFSRVLEFDDYTGDELGTIFARAAAAADFSPTPDAVEAFARRTATVERGPAFGNARWVRNVLDVAVARHAWRLRDVARPTLDELRTLLPQDLAPDDGPTQESA